MNNWLHAKCRKYLDPQNHEEELAESEAEVEIEGDYDGNPIAGV